MAYQFADGFDNYGNTFTMVAGYPWDTIGGGATTSTADFRFSPPGSTPGGCVTMNTGSNMRKNLSGNETTLIVGFGYKATTLPTSGLQEVCGFYDLGTDQCTLALNSAGALQFYRGNVGGTAIGSITSSGTVVAGTWYGFAISVTFGSSTGAVSLYINGNPVAAINSAGLNNITTANSYANQTSIGPTNAASGGPYKYDDFFVFDSTGGALNSLLGGDARIITKMPVTPNGTYTNWTPTGLANNYANVANTPPNTSDYNANNVATTKDSYNTQVASLAVAPYFVMVRASLERDDAGTHNPSIFVRSNTTDSSGVATPTLTSSYLFYDAIFANDPNTSSAWTGAGADNAQIGIIEG
jgi:hypothetical protein